MTGNKQQSTTQSQALLDEASGWIVRLSNESATEQDHQSFALWLGKSHQHRAAYDEVESLWFDLGCVRYVEPISEPILEDQPGPGEGQPSSSTKQSSSLWAKIAKARNFAAAFALCAVAGALYLSLDHEQEWPEQNFATAIGEQRTVTLSDGSKVQLNTNSRLLVQYSADQRTVNLSQGEAYFDVSTDLDKPFIVLVPGGSVTAVGTAFNIEIDSQQTLVTVTEGVIRVEENNNSALPPHRLTAKINDSVSIHPMLGLERVELSALDAITAWREQNLIFRNASLAEIVAELNRYSEHKIKIADASLAYIQLSGVFKLDNPVATLEAIQTTLGLQSKAQDQIILLFKQG
ncbi:MAG: FecR domain-containing protein [Pseudomonadales bacterium]